MCGIAGLIHRGKSSKVGFELQGMLQALKHRGEDSTGYALYGDTEGKNFIMRIKIGENVGEGSSSVATEELPSPTFSPILIRIIKFFPSVSPYRAYPVESSPLCFNA